MMEFALERCRQKGCYKLVLSSNAKRTRAHAFYELLGFERHGYSFRVDLERSPNEHAQRRAAADEQPLLVAQGLSKWYGRQLGCRDVSFELYAGEVLAIVGESGSGKTTLLQLLSCQLAPMPAVFATAPATAHCAISRDRRG